MSPEYFEMLYYIRNLYDYCTECLSHRHDVNTNIEIITNLISEITALRNYSSIYYYNPMMTILINNALSKTIDILKELYNRLDTSVMDERIGIITEIGLYIGFVPRRRKKITAEAEAKIEAYSDPDVAAMAEMTTGGIKTRSRYYPAVPRTVKQN